MKLVGVDPGEQMQRQKGAHSGVRSLPVRSRPQRGDIVKCGHPRTEGEKVCGCLAFFRPTNLASEPTSLRKRLYCHFSLTFTLLLTNRSSPYWPCLMYMYLLLSTCSITKSFLSVLRPRVESHLSLFFGSNLTPLTVLKRLSQVNLGLP